MLAYLEHVVERFDLARDIQLNTGVTGAVFDESDELWTVTTSTGVTLTARYLVNALGLLAKSNISDIAGRDSVAGTLVHTNAWPKDLDIAGKRVGVIGTGSTGTQFIVAAAKTAGYLSVFQRSPQYWVPSGNGPMDKSEVEPIMADFDNVWDQVRNSVVAFGFEESTVGHERVRRGTAQGVPGCLGQGQRVPVHVRHVLRHRDQPGSQCGRRGVPPLEDRRDRRGPGDRAQAHADRSLRQAAAVQRGVLRDLQPGQSRVGLHQGEPDHRDHPGGVRTADGIEHELDILVFATGFDAVGGNYRAMDLRGRGGRHINEHWAGGPTSYLGVSPAGFPNMFMILGPNGPFTNLPPSIATQVDWIGELIATAERTGVRTVEPAREAEDQWTATCAEIADTGYAGFELARAGETATV
ncbi:flavin-containing monooxygenase [Amycolatopsis thermoflava]|uniref:flavin-containing monooxygenase n=1 Tax=Amycolatopsis thermoflava TaxID=84480 RepID=UPI00364BF05D